MPSPPATPSLDMPKKRAQRRFKEPGIEVEWVEEYRPGGLHPIDLGDTLKDGQYRIMRKLGYGSFSTVWLAEDADTGILVALKVGSAKSAGASKEASMYQRLDVEHGHKIAKLLDAFKHDSPNGMHQCLAFEVMGPSASFMFEHLPADLKHQHSTTRSGLRDCFPLWMAKKLIKDMLEGIKTLHSNNIVHGDLQFGNLLMKTRPIEKHMMQRIGQPVAGHERTSALVRRRDGKSDPWAPQYLYVAMPLDQEVELAPHAVEAKISDLGGAFLFHEPPPRIVTPTALRAPELVLGLPLGEKIDIWNFGCLLFEICTGLPLFCMFVLPDQDQRSIDDEHLLLMFDVLGPLPANMRGRWPRYDRYFGPDGENIRTQVLQFSDAGDGPASNCGCDTDSLSSDEIASQDGHQAASKDGMEADLGSNGADSDGATIDVDEESDSESAPSLEDLLASEKLDDIDDKEAEQILSLIRKALQYEARDRPTAAELLQDPWFNSI